MSGVARGSIAALCGIGINLALLALLGHIARPSASGPPPIATRPLHAAPPLEPPPPPPIPQEPPPERPTVAEPLAAPPVPALELPPLTAAADPLRLPTLAADPDPRDLPALALPRVVAAPPATQGRPGPGDRRARLTFAPDLEAFYPRTARIRQVEGRTRLRLALDARGAVVEAAVLHSDPMGVFDAAALVAARRLRYAPAVRQGRAAPAIVEVTLAWRLQ